MHEAVDAARTGAFLCTLRKARGMTQEQVAEALCVSNKTISKWESGGSLR
ncbi:MAG: helix-turn-helix transcriptional regulator [Clostridiaceae bacterium]|nr:helix-turn-helix transcriptional regulator [Clostridiaceae bacterium]